MNAGHYHSGSWLAGLSANDFSALREKVRWAWIRQTGTGWGVRGWEGTEMGLQHTEA